MPEITRDQTHIEAGPRAVLTGTVTSQESQELWPPSNLTPLLSMTPNEVPRSKRGRLTLEAERNLLHEHDGMVVIPRKRQNRGAPISKIQVRWRNITIPCNYSDRLTPAMLIEAIRLSPLTCQDTLAKATLTPPNNLLATLHLHVTLRSQGIFAGDIVTLVTRHARVYDPYGVQHFVAYRDEDTIQYFLSVLQDISPTPFLSELVVCHESLPLEPTSRFQDCNLPQEPSLHVRFRSHSGAHPLQEPVGTEPTPTAGNSPGETWIPSPIANGPTGHLLQTQEPKHGLGDTGRKLSFSLSQTFVQDPRGKTHVLLFLPTDSIATNLLRYSAQLPLPPFADLYILSGSQVLKTECTELENGLHSKPHLKILLKHKHTHTHTHTHIHTHTHTHTHTHSTHTLSLSHTHTQIHIHTHTYT